MDWVQLSIAIIIPLLVSVIAWTLTYIIPYISPNWISNMVIGFTEDVPEHPIEIGLIVNQFSKYDDWKRLTACKKIKRMFILKVREIESYKWNDWVKLKEEVKNMPLDHVLSNLNILLSDIDNAKMRNNELLPENTKQQFIKHKMEVLREKQEEYTEISKDHENAKIWWGYYITPKQEENYNKGNYVLTIEELDVLYHLKHSILDKDGLMTVEEFLKREGKYKPDKKSEEEILADFDNVILYVDYPHSKKKELIYRLALGLSDHKLSHKTLTELINEAESQTWQKDYKEYKKRAGW